MEQLVLFISAVSDEFSEKPGSMTAAGPGDYRHYLKEMLNSPHVTAKIQEDLIDGGLLTLDRLALYIQSCDAVIHLVGDMAGAAASRQSLESLFNSQKINPDVAPNVSSFEESVARQFSYTQWEAYLALQLGKRLLICVKDPAAPKATGYRNDDEQRRRQDDHLALLARGKHYPLQKKFLGKEDLAAEIWRNVSAIAPPGKRELLPPLVDGDVPVFLLRISQPHPTFNLNRVVAVSLKTIPGKPRIVAVAYELQCTGKNAESVPGSAENLFMAHFEAHETDECELAAEIETDSGLKIKLKPVSIAFAEANRPRAYEFAGEGSIVRRK